MATDATLVETNDTPDHDTLVPDPQVQKEFGVTAMSIWRWDRDPELITLEWPRRLWWLHSPQCSVHDAECWEGIMTALAVNWRRQTIGTVIFRAADRTFTAHRSPTTTRSASTDQRTTLAPPSSVITALDKPPCRWRIAARSGPHDIRVQGHQQ